MLVAAGVVLLSGCKVLTTEEDRQLRARASGAIDVNAEVNAAWEPKVGPALDKAAVPLTELAQAIGTGQREAYGAVHGRRPSQDAPYAFVVKGEGVVRSVDRTSRQGVVVVDVGGIGNVRLTIGPVIVSTALRDSLPFYSFNQMPDQLAYAAVSRQLNARAMGQAGPVAAQLAPGMKVSFLGVTQEAGAPGEPWQVLPVRIAVGGAGAS